MLCIKVIQIWNKIEGVVDDTVYFFIEISFEVNSNFQSGQWGFKAVDFLSFHALHYSYICDGPFKA